MLVKKYMNFEKNLISNELEKKKIEVIRAGELPDNLRGQLEALNDKRLENITINIVPDSLWTKGDQPTESEAERQLIYVKQSYYESINNNDEIAWLIHELAHCQKFLDLESLEDYEKSMRTLAFTDLKSEYSYPNNPIEQYAFTKQFEYLKKGGKSKEDILEMLKEYYGEEDTPFFSRLLEKL